MRSESWVSKSGAVAYALWGIVHVLGGAMQLLALRSGGGKALTAMISTAAPFETAGPELPAAAAAYMGMGAFTLVWLGALVTWVAVTQNWRNSRLGYWLNLTLVGTTDLGLLLALLLPGHMAWSDGMVGLGLFALALCFSTFARARDRSPLRTEAAA